MISSQKSVVHNELLVKSEILHWNCDCSLHLDVLCSTTIFTIQRLKPEWNFTQEKGNWSKDIILLRSVQMCGCYVYTLFTAEWLTACFVFTGNLSVYKVVVLFVFSLFGFFPCETTILWLAIQYESDVCRFCFLGLPYQRQEQLTSQLVFH